jgi:hypothetical protein
MPETTDSAVRLRVRLPRNARSVLRKRARAAGELFYPSAPYGLGPGLPLPQVRGQAALTQLGCSRPAEPGARRASS